MRGPELVGREHWEPWVEADFAGIAPPLRSRAVAILAWLHDRGVAAPPETALQLAVCLDAESRPASPGGNVWWLFLERLAVHLEGEERRGRPAAQRDRVALLPGAAPFYFLRRIGAPLVALAAERAAPGHLFSRSTTASLVAAGVPCSSAGGVETRYAAFRERFRLSLDRLVARPDELFATDRGITLAALSGRGGGAGGGIPSGDRPGLAYLARLRPIDAEVAAAPAVKRRRSRVVREERLRILGGEGGIDGIHRSRRLEDLPMMTGSEVVHLAAAAAERPDPAGKGAPPRSRERLLERLLDRGFLALRRPPLRQRRRQMLVVGILPPPSGTFPVRALALCRATWQSAVRELGGDLQRSGRERSELAWLEADPDGALIELRAPVDRLPYVPPVARDDEAGPLRGLPGFLLDAGWLPELLDRRAVGSGPEGVRDRQAPGWLREIDWAARAWRGLHDLPYWSHEEDPAAAGPERPLALEEYHSVHVTVFLSRPAGASGLPRSARLRHRVGLRLGHGVGLLAVWVPRRCDDLGVSGWAVGPSDGRAVPLGRGIPTEERDRGDLDHRIAGAILDRWREDLRRGLAAS